MFQEIITAALFGAVGGLIGYYAVRLVVVWFDERNRKKKT